MTEIRAQMPLDAVSDIWQEFQGLLVSTFRDIIIGAQRMTEKDITTTVTKYQELNKDHMTLVQQPSLFASEYAASLRLCVRLFVWGVCAQVSWFANETRTFQT